MSLNPIELSDKTGSLGFGLDFRIDRSQVTEVMPFNWYVASSSVDSTERMLSDELSGTEQYQWPTSPTIISIASNNTSDTNKTIRIYYWENSTSEYETYEDIKTNDTDGTIPVNSTNTIYRIRMIVNLSPVPGTGNIYVGPNTATWNSGKPDVIYGSMSFDRGISTGNLLYCPPGWHLFNVSFEINSDCDSNNKIEYTLYRQPSPYAPLLKYKLLKNYMSSDNRNYSTITTPSVSPGSMSWITAKKVGISTASNITIVSSYVFVKTLNNV